MGPRDPSAETAKLGEDSGPVESEARAAVKAVLVAAAAVSSRQAVVLPTRPLPGLQLSPAPLPSPEATSQEEGVAAGKNLVSHTEVVDNTPPLGAELGPGVPPSLTGDFLKDTNLVEEKVKDICKKNQMTEDQKVTINSVEHYFNSRKLF